MKVLMLLDPSYSPGVLGAAKFLLGGVVGLLWCASFHVTNIALYKLSRRRGIMLNKAKLDRQQSWFDLHSAPSPLYFGRC